MRVLIRFADIRARVVQFIAIDHDHFILGYQQAHKHDILQIRLGYRLLAHHRQHAATDFQTRRRCFAAE